MSDQGLTLDQRIAKYGEMRSREPNLYEKLESLIGPKWTGLASSAPIAGAPLAIPEGAKNTRNAYHQGDLPGMVAGVLQMAGGLGGFMVPRGGAAAPAAMGPRALPPPAAHPMLNAPPRHPMLEGPQTPQGLPNYVGDQSRISQPVNIPQSNVGLGQVNLQDTFANGRFGGMNENKAANANVPPKMEIEARNNYENFIQKILDERYAGTGSTNKYGLHDRSEDTAARYLAETKGDKRAAIDRLNSIIKNENRPEEFQRHLYDAIGHIKSNRVNLDNIHNEVGKEHGIANSYIVKREDYSPIDRSDFVDKTPKGDAVLNALKGTND